jgi:hypothetical protein
MDAEKKQPKLTMKQRKFLKLYFETGNGTQAALAAYDTDDPRAASVIAAENLAKLREPVRALMEAKGISVGRLIEILDEGLQANKVVSAQVLVKQDGSVLKKEDEGMIEVPDHFVRRLYVETAAKWLGLEKEPGAQGNTFNGPVQIIFKRQEK